MHIRVWDEIVALGFVTVEEQSEFAIFLENNMHGSADAALECFNKNYTGILTNDLGFYKSDWIPVLSSSFYIKIVIGTVPVMVHITPQPTRTLLKLPLPIPNTITPIPTANPQHFLMQLINLPTLWE